MTMTETSTKTSKVIEEYPLLSCEKQTLQLSAPWEILDVQAEKMTPTMWVVVTLGGPIECVTVMTYKTGHPLKTVYGKHVGSYHIPGDQTASHVFVRTGPKPKRQGH